MGEVSQWKRSSLPAPSVRCGHVQDTPMTVILHLVPLPSCTVLQVPSHVQLLARDPDYIMYGMSTERAGQDSDSDSDLPSRRADSRDRVGNLEAHSSSSSSSSGERESQSE